MLNLYEKSKGSEPKEELGKAIQQLIEDNLNLQKWNFKLSYCEFNKFPYQKMMYDSPYCRIGFTFHRERWPKYDELSIYYGRLHAPDDKAFIHWQGEECHCWHSRYNHLRFLDGLTAREAMERDKVNKYFPDVLEDFYNSELGKKIREGYSPKFAIGKQSVIWEHYGQRLFDLFDLRQPELWEKYRAFLREYYQLTGEKSLYGPPHENVC